MKLDTDQHEKTILLAFDGASWEVIHVNRCASCPLDFCSRIAAEYSLPSGLVMILIQRNQSRESFTNRNEQLRINFSA